MKTQEVRKLFSLFSILTIFAVLLIGNINAFGAVIVSEDWDSGTPPVAWPCKLAPSGTCSQNLLFNGWWSPLAEDCLLPYYANTGVVSTRAHSGTKSFYTFRAAGNSYSCDIVKDFPSPYKSKIYIRFYLYLDSDFIFFNTPVTREPSYHLFFTNTAQSGTGLRVNMAVKVPYVTSWTCGAGRGGVPSDRPYAFFDIADYTSHWPVGTYPAGCYNMLDHIGQWVSYEFEMDAPNNSVKIWADGILVYNSIYRITDSNFTRLIFSNYMSDEDGTPFSNGYFVDDIVVADSYIGPMPSSGAPSPPINLKAIP